METSGKIEFKVLMVYELGTRRKKRDAIAVLRDKKQVALLYEADRLQRALKLTIPEIEDTLNHFSAIMGREPTVDEREFWKAVLDYKRIQSKNAGNQ